MRLEDLTDRMEKFDKLLQAQHHWLDQCSVSISQNFISNFIAKMKRKSPKTENYYYQCFSL